jgi:hypothetical protein
MNKGIQIELPEAVGGELLGRVVELVRMTTTTTEERIIVRGDDDEAEAQPVNAEPRVAGPIAVRPNAQIVVPRKVAGEGGR